MADVSSLAYVDGMSAFTKIVIKIYNKVSNNTISEYLTKVAINVCLPSPYNADSYYIS